ncbi:MAG: ribonuclease HI [Clostridia bacterium]|jgi:ribonuclease HI|nr:ribonuclease HI [Clostridia bacterium]
MKELKHVDIFTDGACSGNPGPGGWGAVLRYGKYEIEISGGEKLTTNNRMELTALISALKKLKEKCEITIYTDSKYIADAFNEGWVSKWILSGWRKADKSPVLNVELWQELVELINVHEFELIWVKGHAGHPENERCDKLATTQADYYSKE